MEGCQDGVGAGGREPEAVRMEQQLAAYEEQQAEVAAMLLEDPENEELQAIYNDLAEVGAHPQAYIELVPSRTSARLPLLAALPAPLGRCHCRCLMCNSACGYMRSTYVSGW